jgi:thymidylate synthase ThyX
MHCEIVYAGNPQVNDTPVLPSTFKKPNDDQLQGTPQEKLIEIAGRCCYASFGTETSRDSVRFHRNLAGLDGTSPHYSVHEHVHFTVETDVNPWLWMGVPDVSVKTDGPKFRVTLNLRHCLEFPDNVVYLSGIPLSDLDDWQDICYEAIARLAPTISTQPVTPEIMLVEPKSDAEAFVSLFLEESLVWSLEQNRHRFNISQRSGRFCDQTDRDFCTHPLLRDYLNEVTGDELLKERDNLKRYGGADSDMLPNAIRIFQTESRILYTRVVNALQDFQAKRTNVDKLTARKQARSAGRYYLPSALSTECIFTASIRSWRKIFAQRCNPAADAAIREISEKAQELVRGSRYGHLL